MNASARRLLLVIPVALLATMAASPSTALAINKGEECYPSENYDRGISECAPQEEVIDVCPEAGIQTAPAVCAAPVPAAAPAPAPAPLPEESEGPAPGNDVEYASLTLDEAADDGPATSGSEVFVANEIVGGGAAGTSSAVVAPTGSLPYTGLGLIELSLLAVSLLWVGALGWFAGSVLRRTAAADLA
jgi:hypothetical protein